MGVLFPEQARLQLRLPMALGGAGMRRAAEHAAGAYLSSVLRAGEADGWLACEAMGFDQALQELCARSGLGAAAVRDPVSVRTQRHFSEAVDKQAFESLLASAPPLDKARLLSVRGAGVCADPPRVHCADQVVVWDGGV
jgi:hypothetical protein